MEVSNEKITKNNLPIKNVNHHDIYSLYDMIEQLNSWNEPLKLIERFFSDQKRPVNKQQIAKQYYAQSKIFNAFISDYQSLIEKLEKQVTILRNSEKL
ncbi:MULTISPECIES: hypothetical protein [Enterococcus]|uniref:hypothetical protein n=1 Tax=Enterococcus TaxID=1350 RepID=UPI001A994D7C|nr:hypothetical protein [Enterococcus faecalis]MEB6069978.1 hypothetical protein [Enterococcus faecalis]MEB6189186.1 hypothetical protein [Enterococcus faecalis]